MIGRIWITFEAVGSNPFRVTKFYLHIFMSLITQYNSFTNINISKKIIICKILLAKICRN